MLIPIGFLGAGGAAGSYELISTAYGTGSSSTITFSSIPSTYKHLEIRGVMSDTDVTNKWLSDVSVRFNSDTASNYSYHFLEGNGTSATSSGGTTSTAMTLRNITTGQFTSGIYGSVVISVLDYANTTTNKTLRYLGGCYANAEKAVHFGSGNWRSTSAVSSITISGGITNWTTASRFSLYGIKG